MSFCKQVVVFILCIFILLLGEAFGAKLYDITLTNGEVLTGWHLYKSQDDPNIFVAKKGSIRRELRRNQIKGFTQASVVPDTIVSSDDTADQDTASVVEEQKGEMARTEIRPYCRKLTKKHVGEYHDTHQNTFYYSCKVITSLNKSDKDVFLSLVPVLVGIFRDYEDCKKTNSQDICARNLIKARTAFGKEHGMNL